MNEKIGELLVKENLLSQEQLAHTRFPLGDLTKFISCVTATNFLLAKKVDGGAAVTMLSPTPVSISEARAAYLSARAANGLTTVRRRGSRSIPPGSSPSRRRSPHTRTST